MFFRKKKKNDEAPAAPEAPAVEVEEYNCKLVGVTFEGRQEAMAAIWASVLADDSPEFDIPATVEKRAFESEDYAGHALYVDVDGVNIGTVGSDDRRAVQTIVWRDHAAHVNLALNGVSLETVWSATRKTDPDRADEFREALRKTRWKRQIYSAVLTVKG